MTISPLKFMGEQDDFSQQPDEQVSRVRSLIGAPIKGAIRGALDLARFSPVGMSLPSNEAYEQQILSKVFPTQEKFAEGALEKGGELFPSLLGGGEGTIAKLIRAGLGGTLGQFAKEMGGNKLVQAIAEAPAIFSPSFAKKIPIKQSQRVLTDFAKKHGLQENQIAPLLNSPESLERWASMAKKGRKTHELMSNLYSETQGIYNTIRNQASQLPPMNNEQINSFLGNLQEVWGKISPDQRRLINRNMNDLFKSNMTWNDVHNFLKDINAKLKPVEGGKNVVGLFKDPAYKALESLDPNLFKELRLADQLYATRANVSSYLKPKQIDSLMDAGEIYGITAAIAQRDLGLLGKVLGAVGGRELAREMLINPRLQNMSNRMLESLSKNNPAVALRYYQKFKEELKETNEKLAESLPERKAARSKINPLPFE